MRRKAWWLTCGLAGSVLAGLLAVSTWRGGDEAPGMPAQQQPVASPVVAWPVPLRMAGAGTPAQAAAQGEAQPAPESGNPLDHVAPPQFKANARGELEVDPDTRIGVERLHALHSADEARAALDDASRTLPAQARRELVEVYQQYVQYTQAATRAYPPGDEVASVDEAARQLEGLSELRRQHFGADRAGQLFGDEERTARELLALMRRQKDTALSLEEKAALAQQALQARQAGAR